MLNACLDAKRENRVSTVSMLAKNRRMHYRHGAPLRDIFRRTGRSRDVVSTAILTAVRLRRHTHLLVQDIYYLHSAPLRTWIGGSVADQMAPPIQTGDLQSGKVARTQSYKDNPSLLAMNLAHR
jgi:hypothetical protein